MKSGRPSVTRRVAVILLAASVIVAFGVYQGRALIRGEGESFRIQVGSAILPPIAGAKFLRAYDVLFNGLRTRFGHYRSNLPAKDVVREYADLLHRATQSAGTAPEPELTPAAGTPALANLGEGRSALSYVTREGTTIGVVAFDNPDAGGSEYFVGSLAARATPRKPGEDCPGREPPGVPKPSRSTRTLCIENIGGAPSVLSFYAGWGSPSGMVDDLTRGMTANRWTARAESSRILTENYDGFALLSFVRGHEQCVIGVDQEPKTGRIIITLLWAERRWLPEGTAL